MIISKKISFALQIVQIFLTVKSDKSYLFKELSEIIVKDVNPYQTYLFIHKDSLGDKVVPEFYIAKKIPCTTTTVLTSDGTGDNLNLTFSTNLKKFSQSSMVIFYARSIHDTKIFVELISSLVPVEGKPKCLVILSKFNASSDVDLKTTLEFAWSHKFLDFSILSINHGDSLFNVIYHFNPFYSKMYKNIFNKSVKIFPKKLSNVNKYPVLIPKIFDGHQFWFFTKTFFRVNGDGERSSFSTDYLTVETVLEIMNFEMIHTTIKPDDLKKMERSSNMSLYSEPVNIKYLPENSLRIHSENELSSFVVLVPILLESQMKISTHILVYGIILLGVVLCLVSTMNYLKIRNKIIYVSLAVTVFIIMHEFYTEIVKITYMTEKVPFTTYEDLDTSGLMMMTNSNNPDDNLTINFDYELAKRMKAKISFEPSIRKCVIDLKKKKENTCAMHAAHAKFVMKRFAGQPPQLKMAKPELFSYDTFYSFENSSPYVYRFTEIMRRVKESGILQMIHLINRYNNDFESQFSHVKDLGMDDRIDCKVLLMILLFCYGAACLTFFIELLTGNRKMIKNKLVEVFQNFRFCKIQIVVPCFRLLLNRFSLYFSSK